jgi:hypothetical protein
MHRKRERIPGNCPVHVTLRVRPDVPSLRSVAFVREFRRSLAEACERGDFRVNHYSLQGDHAWASAGVGRCGARPLQTLFATVLASSSFRRPAALVWMTW